MRKYVEIATQAELDALKMGDVGIVRTGRFVAWESAHVVAWESAHVVARGSAHVVARGSAHVVARESAHVVAWESAHVVASQYVAIHRHSTASVVIGGTVIEVKRPVTPGEWAAFYGTPITNDTILVYKALQDDYRSSHGFMYQPGTTVSAPDWDGGQAECGGGLHFSPHPAMALEFDPEATRFMACPVALEDIRAPQESDEYPNKIKARRTSGPIFEVDRTGKAVVAP